jgi:hypothetical protein
MVCGLLKEQFHVRYIEPVIKMQWLWKYYPWVMTRHLWWIWGDYERQQRLNNEDQMVVNEVKMTWLRQKLTLLPAWTGWGFSTFSALLPFASECTVNFTDRGPYQTLSLASVRKQLLSKPCPLCYVIFFNFSFHFSIFIIVLLVVHCDIYQSYAIL